MEAVVADLYKKYDTDGDGTLSTAELQNFYNDLAAARSDLGLSGDGYQAWFTSLDKDGDGTVSPVELANYLSSINFSA